jgi:predicted transcriptional regulator
MSEGEKTALIDPGDVPEGMSEQEAREFWDTHEITEEYLEKTGPPPEGVLPPAGEPRRPRARPIGVRFDDDVIQRLKTLADRKQKGYQTLLKEFVVERLYEEEKREGLIK